MIMLNLIYPFKSCLFPLVHLHISYLYCAKAKTNMFPWASHVLSLRLKGKWSIWQRHRFHSTSSVLSFLAGIPPSLQIWYNPHSYLVYQRVRESKKGLYFTHKSLFLAIHAKGGESISPKQKDRTTTNLSNRQVFQFVF
jgi:hypothetical protein